MDVPGADYCGWSVVVVVHLLVRIAALVFDSFHTVLCHGGWTASDDRIMDMPAARWAILFIKWLTPFRRPRVGLYYKACLLCGRLSVTSRGRPPPSSRAS